MCRSDAEHNNTNVAELQLSASCKLGLDLSKTLTET